MVSNDTKQKSIQMLNSWLNKMKYSDVRQVNKNENMFISESAEKRNISVVLINREPFQKNMNCVKREKFLEDKDKAIELKCVELYYVMYLVGNGVQVIISKATVERYFSNSLKKVYTLNMNPEYYREHEKNNIIIREIINGTDIHEKSTRNPVWQRDELILALELFYRYNPSKINKIHPEVTKLSELLNKLAIYTNRPKDTFRNNNEVYMKLSNFLRFDSSYSGKGLTGGGKLEEDIWNEFVNDLNGLKLASELIKSNVEIDETARKVKDLVSKKVMDKLKKQTIIFGERELENAISNMSDEEFKEYIKTFDENASLEVRDGLVKIRKFNKKIIDDLKKRTGYCCQICGLSSMEDYGVSVVEGHHIESFSLTQNNKPENIIILCPNHHRLIHKAKGILNKSNLTIKYANGKVDIITIPLHFI